MAGLKTCSLAAAGLAFALQLELSLILAQVQNIFQPRRRQSLGHAASMLDYLTGKSNDRYDGEPRFDRDEDDFDILLALIDAAGIDNALSSPNGGGGGLDDVTLFAPRDGAFYNLAKNLGYNGKRRDEGKIFTFLAGVLTVHASQKGMKVGAVISDVLVYHIGNAAMKEDKLRRKGHITTINGMKIKVVKARRVDGEKRTKLIALGSNAIMHKRRNDIKTKNGMVHVLKDVLLPFELASKTVDIEVPKTLRPTPSPGRRPTTAPVVLDETRPPAVASPTASPLAASPCVPTTGPCISTEAEFREVTRNLEANAVLAICGTAEDVASWTFQMRTSTIIDQDNVTLCCAGPKQCRVRAQQNDQGLPIDRILVVTGESFAMKDISFFFGVGGRSLAILKGNDAVGNAGGGNLAIVAGGKHVISDCYFGGGFSSKPDVSDTDFLQGSGGNLYISAHGGGEVKIVRTTIEKGSAQSGGGAAIMDTARVVLEDSIVRGNKGGGLFVSSGFMSNPSQTIEFRGTSFHSNRGDWGGGFMASAIGALPTLLVEDCIFERNAAYNGGAGAVFPDLGKFASLRFADNEGKGNAAEATPPAVLEEDVCDGLLLATIDPARPEYVYECIDDMTATIDETSGS